MRFSSNWYHPSATVLALALATALAAAAATVLVVMVVASGCRFNRGPLF